MRNAGLEEAQAGIKTAKRNINNLRYADDITLMAENEELKSFLMKVKEESEKSAENSTFKKLRSWHLVPSLSAIRVVLSAYLSLFVISPSNFDSSLCFLQPSVSHDVLFI